MLPNKEPVAFEWWIFKWVFMPILIFGLLFSLLDNESDRAKCYDTCEIEGYLDARYVPADRVGLGKKCVCKNVNDAEDQKEIHIKW